ncbi:MAG: hypothetical protein JJU05_18250 [Verrucomicrobia bacterium]|nr:hypothetical protein [Verrucomicrobiota bacterium]MCH8528544.1 hypothetical protein [Kiritimatiellia bacterium]
MCPLCGWVELHGLVAARESSKQAGEVEAQPEDAWDDVALRLKEEVRLRQYSDKTVKEEKGGAETESRHPKGIGKENEP